MKGRSMKDERIFPRDMVVVEKHATVRNGHTVIALVNGEGTMKTDHRKGQTVELHPANESMQPTVVRFLFVSPGYILYILAL
jgi:repressor LexA